VVQMSKVRGFFSLFLFIVHVYIYSRMSMYIVFFTWSKFIWRLYGNKRTWEFVFSRTYKRESTQVSYIVVSLLSVALCHSNFYFFCFRVKEAITKANDDNQFNMSTCSRNIVKDHNNSDINSDNDTFDDI
jgi:hypothetical protein